MHQQHVWLPSLRVWAPITDNRPSSCSSSSSSSSLSHDISDRSYATQHPSFALETEDSVRNKERKKHKKKRRERKDDDDDADCDGEKKKRRRKPNHMCPICLCSVEEANLSVLQWCMHSFCVECIEKWSKQERFCPLCKQTFHGWYYNIRRSGECDVKKLAKLTSSSSSPLQLHDSNQISSWQRIQRYPNSRFQRGSMSEAFPQRSHPLPRRRSFGASRGSSHSQPKRDEENRINETLKWRASIYKRHLRAIPPQINTRVNMVSIDGPDRKTRIEKRLKPWIIRELHAITGDPEPSLLVQFVLSLWINVVMHKENGGLQESEAIEQLKPFLDKKAADFWHEMKCFAESPFSLMAYDSVVKYKRCYE